MDLTQDSLFLPVEQGHKIHIKLISSRAENPPVVFIPGIAENGRIFYSNSLKGIAPFFAKDFNCYVVDLRGKGLSTPKVSRENNYNHLDSIQDLAKVFQFVRNRHPKQSQFWLAHSWGGVLVNSMFLRYPEFIEFVSGSVFFGTKRSISVSHLEKSIKFDLFYRNIFSWVGEIEGYIDPRFFGFEREALDLHKDVVKLAKMGPYVEPSDSFDYRNMAPKVKLPKCLSIAAINDTYLGHQIDVKRFMEECHQDYDFWLLSRKTGNLHDYDHNDMLTHKDAVRDHFPKVLEWMKN